MTQKTRRVRRRNDSTSRLIADVLTMTRRGILEAGNEMVSDDHRYASVRVEIDFAARDDLIDFAVSIKTCFPGIRPKGLD